jgi:hypothetical protein
MEKYIDPAAYKIESVHTQIRGAAAGGAMLSARDPGNQNLPGDII